MKHPDNPHLALCLRLERAALIARYLLYAIGLACLTTGLIDGTYVDLAVVTAVVVIHAAFVHVVFWTQRYQLFFSHWNFIIYFVEAVIVVKFTGAEQSEMYIVFHLLLIGYSIYSRRFWRVMAAAAGLTVSYGLVILVEYFEVGLSARPGIIIVRFFSILVTGWIIGLLSDLFRRTEEGYLSKTAALASSEATLRTILDRAADPIVVFEDHEFITDANAAACRFFGLPREKLLGQRVRTFLFDDGTLSSEMAALRARGQIEGEQIFISASDSERVVHVVVQSFYRERQRYFVAIFHDISVQKEIDETVRLANKRLEQLNAQLKEVDRLKTDFLSAIGHKLRSPLSAVIGYIEMTLHEELGPLGLQQQKALQTCRRSMLRVFHVIDEALVLAGAGRAGLGIDEKRDGREKE